MEIVIVDDEMLKVEVEALTEEMPENNYYLFNDCDAAYDYVCGNNWHIDLLLIDEDFKNNTDDSVYENGSELGQAIDLKFSYIPMVMFTAVRYDVPHANKVLKKCGFIKLLSKSDFIRNFKTEIENIRRDAETLAKYDLRRHLLLKELSRVFNLVEPTQRDSILRLLNQNTDIRNKEINIGLGEITIGSLLKKYINLETVKVDELNLLILKSIATKVKRNTLLSPSWKKDTLLLELLKEYLNNESEHKFRRAAIEKRAFDILTEIIIGAGKFDGKKNLSISRSCILENMTSKPTNNKSSRTNDNILQDKLIGRRIIIAYQKLYNDKSFSKPYLKLQNVVNLLKIGYTGTYSITKSNMGDIISHQDVSASCKISKIISEALGLSSYKVTVGAKEVEEGIIRVHGTVKKKTASTSPSYDSNVHIESDYLLEEEEIWYDNIGQSAVIVADLIQNFSPSSDIAFRKNGYRFGDCYNVTEFSTMLIDIRKLEGDKIYNKVINGIRDYIKEKFTKHENIEFVLQINPR